MAFGPMSRETKERKALLSGLEGRSFERFFCLGLRPSKTEEHDPQTEEVSLDRGLRTKTARDDFQSVRFVFVAIDREPVSSLRVVSHFVPASYGVFGLQGRRNYPVISSLVLRADEFPFLHVLVISP